MNHTTFTRDQQMMIDLGKILSLVNRSISLRREIHLIKRDAEKEVEISEKEEKSNRFSGPEDGYSYGQMDVHSKFASLSMCRKIERVTQKSIESYLKFCKHRFLENYPEMSDFLNAQIAQETIITHDYLIEKETNPERKAELIRSWK